MIHLSRLPLKVALSASVLSGALLLAPLDARAQDAPPAPAVAIPGVAPGQAPGQAPSQAPGVMPLATAWTTFKGDAQRTGATAATIQVPLTLQWRFSSIGPARSYITSPLIIGAPGSQRVIFATGSVVYATDVNTGAQVWKSPDLLSDVSVPLTLISTDDGDLILAMQSSGRLVALKTADGGRAWEVDCGALATESGPIVVKTNNGTRIVCALNTGRVVAVDPKGVLDKDWKLQLGSVGNSAASSITLSRDGSRMFLLGSDARLYIINVREARVLYSVPQAARSSVTPVATQDVVFTANARRVAAWRISDGVADWSLTPKGDVVGSPALMPATDGGKSGATLFFGTRAGEFMAVDAAKGTVKWQKTLIDNVSITGSPVVLPGAVVVGTSAGTLIAFDPANGDIVWQYRLKTERAYDLNPNKGRGGGGRGQRNRGGDGGDIGGDLGAGANGATAAPEKIAYGISSAPAVIDGKMFVLGDDAALYAFTSQAFDADPPRIIEPSIAINATDQRLLALLLKPDTPQIVPGVGPFYFAAQIDDVGSGINPDSIAVTINDKPVEAARVFYGRASGVLTITLVDPAKSDPALPDGLKKMVISAKDYAGNITSFSTNFLVDNTAPVPAPPRQFTRDGQPGGPDGGGLGGPDGGGPGGGGGNFGP